jgi:hypothetical protein
MTISISGAAPGPTAGPAGEYPFVNACLAYGCGIEPFGVEHRLSKPALDIAFASYASFAADPDFIVYRWLPANNWFGVPPDRVPIWFGVDVKGVVKMRDNPMAFAITPSAVNGMIAFISTHRMWGVFALVPWNGADIRIITPFQVMTWLPNQYGDYFVDGQKYPTLAQWLDEFPPYVGGGLARNWQQPPIQLAPQQAA